MYDELKIMQLKVMTIFNKKDVNFKKCQIDGWIKNYGVSDFNFITIIILSYILSFSHLLLFLTSSNLVHYYNKEYT